MKSTSLNSLPLKGISQNNKQRRSDMECILDTYGIQEIFCQCGHEFDRDNHEPAYIYQDASGHDLKDGFFCQACARLLDDDVENVVEIAIKKAMEYEKSLGSDLAELDSPYERICEYINPSDLWPKGDDETSHKWEERVESEIDTVWTNMK